MFLSKRFITLTLSFFVLLSVFAFTYNDRLFQIQKNLDIFTTLYKEVNMFYVDEVNPNTLMKTGIDAMLNSLDPYTNYIAEDQIEDYRTMTTGQYGGIGALVGNRNGKTTIIMPYEGFPAHDAKIKIGDEIVAIDGISLEGKNSSQVSKLLKGQAGTTVRLEIKSYGNTNTQELQLERENIKVDNVPYHGLVAEGVGYLKLSEFTSNASREVEDAVEALKKEGAKKIILDLRGNPGGLLNEAVNISNLFISRDQEVCSTRSKLEEWNKTYRALNPPMDIEIPLIVLVNGRSASASEIVSGVLQDYDRGVLVGQRSFGKGLVQTTRPLSYNSQLKVTTAKYYIPSGRCIQALDYSHRNEDGSVDKFSDSLKTAFKTKNGRVVYDGAGLKPDIVVAPKNYASISTALVNSNLLFEYANKYAYEHPSIESAETFKLSEQEYQEFAKWVKDKEYSYNTEVESSIKDLEESAKNEKYYESLQSQIQALKAKVSMNKIRDLQNFKKEIRILLEQEIIGHYYLEEGRTKHSFRYDPDLNEALDLFKNMDRYQKILKGSK